MLRLVNGLMAALFVVSAGLQYNDPDPARWVALYGGAALVCILSATRPRLSVPFAALWHAASLVWLGTLLPGVWGEVAPADLFEGMQAKNGLVEVGREAGGLAIVAAWMAVLIVAGRRRGQSEP